VNYHSAKTQQFDDKDTFAFQKKHLFDHQRVLQSVFDANIILQNFKTLC